MKLQLSFKIKIYTSLQVLPYSCKKNIPFAKQPDIIKIGEAEIQ